MISLFSRKLKPTLNTAGTNPSARALIAKCAKSPDTFNSTIYAEDEVYLHGLQHLKNAELALILYFQYGAQIMETVRKIAKWKFDGLSNVPSFLDFACGYGRFSRFLVQELPPNRVWVSDIYANAVDFQRRQFGVNGFVSVKDPTTLICGQQFDLILVASLFSHLPERRFGPWLRTLHHLLTPDGLLAFSVHDEYILRDRPMPSTGFCFVADSETKYLDSLEYGTTFVTEDFVRNTIVQMIGPDWPAYRLKRGLCSFQDIYLVPKNPREDFSSFRYRFGPEGHVDWFNLTAGGQLRLGGWAGDPDDGMFVKEIQLLVGGEIVQRCHPGLPRPDVVDTLRMPAYAMSGWECAYTMKVPPPQLDNILEVWALSDDNTRTLLHLSTIRGALKQK